MTSFSAVFFRKKEEDILERGNTATAVIKAIWNCTSKALDAFCLADICYFYIPRFYLISKRWWAGGMEKACIVQNKTKLREKKRIGRQRTAEK